MLACLLLAGWLAVASAVIRRMEDIQPGSDQRVKAPVPLRVSHPAVISATEFAVFELQRLSESGIYETLTLKKVHYGAVQEGVFHNNTFLTLELASPHLLDAESTLHDVIVMEDLEDGVRSLAIDEFPVMKEDDIEQFWIQRVERDRLDRDTIFRELEDEAELFERGMREMKESVQVNVFGVTQNDAVRRRQAGGDV